MNVNNRQKLLTILAAAVVVVWAGDNLVVEPLIKSWKGRKAEVIRLRRDISDGERTLSRGESIRQRWENMRTNTLPGEVSLAKTRMVEAFDRWSEGSQISITSIDPQEKRAADDYMTVECHVAAFGNLASVTRFLYELEKDPRAFKVETLQLGSRDNDGQQLTLSLQVSGLLLNQADQ
ncbi:MAG: type 4a pilus biogenesis protein PilO [Verrucomicrobia bacterium]|nr:type 4a pilus biogenesis protein PilO [Verrucomicrobiota bacterium]